MSSIVQPVAPGTSDDPEVNELIDQAVKGWWHDSAMMGAIAHQPDLLKTILPVFESFFIAGRIPAHLFEMMRLKTGEINRCGYCMTVRAAGVVDQVSPKEEAFMGEIDESAFTRSEYLGIKLAEYMAGDPNYIPDEFYDELRKEFTKEEIVELIFACSVFNFGNKFNITMRLDTTDESDYETEMAYPFIPKAAANG